ncbi:MAG: type IV conjugative transfer system protein TraL [Panacagrimonas sp.]
MDGRFVIPRTLDDPPLFFMWNFDEAVIVIVLAILFGILGQLVPGAVLGYVLARAYARLKAQGGRGLLMKALYWTTPSDWWLPSRAPSHIREYVGG